MIDIKKITVLTFLALFFSLNSVYSQQSEDIVVTLEQLNKLGLVEQEGDNIIVNMPDSESEIGQRLYPEGIDVQLHLMLGRLSQKPLISLSNDNEQFYSSPQLDASANLDIIVPLGSRGQIASNFGIERNYGVENYIRLEPKYINEKGNSFSIKSTFSRYKNIQNRRLKFRGQSTELYVFKIL